MTPSEQSDSRLVHIIACELDKPSVYMGGPSARSLRVAREVEARIRTHYSLIPADAREGLHVDLGDA